jgi:hypothetical protein
MMKMTDFDLIARLRYLTRVTRDYDQGDMIAADYAEMPVVTKEAADRIEALIAEVATCQKYRDAYAECDTNFSTGAVFPMDVKKLSKLVRETKCPTCGAGSKKLYLQANVKEESHEALPVLR